MVERRPVKASAAGSSPALPAIIESGAYFSDDRVYRYRLWRYWDLKLPLRMWLMLNPSTADETANDPTVERCQRRNVQDGYGGIVVCNIFALRSTDPRALYAHKDPIGMLNDAAIIDTACDVLADGGQIVCGWGQHGRYLGRGLDVIKRLRFAGIPMYVLRKTRDGNPGHPLYISYDVKPQQLAL